jgi:hypothetical protein
MMRRWAFVVLAGCSSPGGPSYSPEVRLTLSTDELTFRSPIGVTATADLIATNENDVPTYAVPKLAHDFGADEFAIAATDCPVQLSPGASCTVTIAFTPQHLGELLSDDFVAIGHSVARLTGNGDVALAISPATHDFGSIYVDKDSEPFTFTIQNQTAVMQHPTANLWNDIDPGFVITASACAEIAPMGTCAVSVGLKAGIPGTRTAKLDIDGAHAALTGVVSNIASPQLYHYGNGYFGNVGIYARPATELFQIVNGTHMDLPQINIAVADASSAVFSIQSNSCTNPIADGASCYVTVLASPTGIGMATAKLSATTPGIPDHSVSLSVTFFDDGPRIAITPSGTVAFTPGQSISFTLTNPSSSFRFIDSVSVPAPYQISSQNCSSNVLPINSSLACNVTVTLTGNGDAHQLLTVAWNQGQQTTVTLVPAN